MRMDSNNEKSIDELTPPAAAPASSPSSMNKNLAITNTSPTPPPSSFFPLANDGTSHTEFSFVENHKYSAEIIEEAKRAFNPEKLLALKEDKNKFLTEAKIQIAKLCQSIDALKVHTSLFEVTFLINLGYLLDEIRPTFEKRSAYTHWLENNFAGHSLEYFQHSLRLAHMGETAIKYRSLGVNRLLEVDRLERDLGKSLDEILKEHSFDDTTEDFGGSLFKTHVDGILTYYRFRKAGVDNIKMEQALQLAQYDHKDIEVKEVKRFKKKYDDAADKDAFINKYVMDKAALTGDGTIRSVSEESLNKVLAELNGYFEKRVNDSQWLKDQKELLDLNIFYRAYGHLTWLKKKLRARSPKGQKSTKKKKR